MDQWIHRCRRLGAAVVGAALLLRIAGDGRLTAAGTGLAPVLFYLQNGPAAAEAPVELPPEPSEPSGPAAEATAGRETVPEETEPVPLIFTAEDLAGLQLQYGGTYRPDIGALLYQELDLDFSGDVPRVLIVHTHATEAYTASPGWEYDDGGVFARTLDTDYNVVRVGDAIAAVLEEAGIGVIHDCTLNDYPSYNDSYDRTLEVIQDYLERYPTITMVLDVHRDALGTDSKGAVTCTLDGEEYAQLMLVVGTDEGGLYHPNWQGNLSWALKLQAVMNRSSPGLCRDISLRTSRFNQHATPASLLIEVGAAGNTLPQALRSAEVFAGALVETIEGMGLNLAAS